MRKQERANPASPVHQTERAQTDLALERKVVGSAWMLFLETLWPRVWVLLAVGGLFVLASALEAWSRLPPLVHQAALACFAIAALAALVFIARTPWPSREAAMRRLESKSGLPHRPASSYEDNLSAGTRDPATLALWQAHRQRLAELMGRMRVTRPEPDVPSRDPWALRGLLLLAVTAVAALAGGDLPARLAGAFKFDAPAAGSSVRIDAWVTPPAYTGKPPVLLADGGRGAAPAPAASGSADAAGFFEVPEGSQLVTRASGVGIGALTLMIDEDGVAPRQIEAERAGTPAAAVAEVVEVRHTLTRSSRIRLLEDGSEIIAWTFSVIPDAPPTIAEMEPPSATRRGSMKLAYKVADDYGVASARARIARVPDDGTDPATAWARGEQALKGPRLPLSRPPELALRLPRVNAREGEAITHLELGSHPWAGLRVTMTLEATDVAGKVGTSEPREIVLPQRQFKKPLARAIVEQRRWLVEDSRNRDRVRKALSALTLEPEGFIDDVQVYLGLRTAYYRLQRDETRPGLDSVIEQLWNVALRIEDGDLSDAERRLRDAQEKLSQALQDGASDEEVEQAMQELRQALDDYLQQLQREAQDNPLRQDGQDQETQRLSQQDLDRMMRDIENMAKNGSRDQAQQMLSELRDMLDRLQSGQQNQSAEGQAGDEMQQMMNELGDIAGQQQRLMDDTFGEQRRDGEQQGQRGQQQGQRGQQQGQRGQQQGQRGQQQGGQRGPQGEQGQRGRDGQSQQAGPSGQRGLSERQSALRERLQQLQREMQQNGMDGSRELGEAQQSMEEAEQALQQGDMEGAMRDQAQALEQLRKGAEQMAQEMRQNSPQRYGRNGDTPRDPLGRPQKSQGPDQGTSVKVPDEIDMQRAREILEELRRRLGEAYRPTDELDYLERLLRRY
ncbi:MAG: TIGR02302 family protein [Hyphomicrobiaceae bacterium]|nr:TIGR02302 family protein [Hyphomicrobiaceae bacterium]